VIVLHGTATRRRFFSTVCVGGTFDIFHDGHRKLLSTAAEASGDGGLLLVGVTSDEFACSTRDRDVRPYEKRVRSVREYLEGTDCSFRIVQLHDSAGPAATDAGIKVIVVSGETRPGAESINAARRTAGLSPLRIVTVDMVLDGDGTPISSSRMAEQARLR